VVCSILFICGSFKDAVSNSDNIASSEWTKVNNKLERVWQEAVVAKFQVLSRHIPEGIEENHEKLYSECQGRYLNREPSKYMPEALQLAQI
jgi:hypothetical protein